MIARLVMQNTAKFFTFHLIKKVRRGRIAMKAHISTPGVVTFVNVDKAPLMVRRTGKIIQWFICSVKTSPRI
jgi:hypothetical protein